MLVNGKDETVVVYFWSAGTQKVSINLAWWHISDCARSN